ncbi:MAG: stalk domain-containing protein [Defluviitaleaceae bacterium]|nr:stalk domain-containing protein [Defluviitaleaceae bacterium]
MKKMMKNLQIKGFVTGFILCLVLSASVMVVANTQTVTREITYGVRVNLNGQLMQFDYDNRPFVMGSRTFLPVRALAEALDLPVDFDPSTNTAYLGNRFAGQRRPLTQAAPHFDTGGGISGGTFDGASPTTAAVVPSLTMGGTTYQNALRFRTTAGSWTPSANTRSSRFTLHNLNGQFRMLTGYFGRVDGTHMTNATINFTGDGQLLASYEVRAGDMPTPISVFVEGVTQLRIEVVFPGRSSFSLPATDYALVAYLE